MRAEAEMAADARALRNTDVSTEAHRLGEVLLGFAHRATAGWLVWFATSTLLGISENKRDLKRRIEALMDIAKGRRTRWIVGLGIFLLLAVAGLTKAPAEDAKKEQTKEAVSKDTAITTTVECIVVDEQGKPVKGADVRLSINLPSKYVSQDKKSGEDGRIRFDEAPKAASMNMTARHPDYADSSMIVFQGYSESKEHRLVLPGISWVVGKVTDKRDGKPLKDARVFYGIENKFTGSSLFEWKFPTVRTNEAGEYRLPLKVRDLKSIFVRAWAPDMTSHSKLLTITQRETAFDGALEPVNRIPGTVVNAEGQPVKDAFVWVVEDAVRLDETEKPLTVEFLKSKSRSKLASGKMFISLDYSKEGGTFRLHDVDPLLKDRLWVVALHPEEGFAQMRARDLKPGAIFKLSRWASMTGKVIASDGKPLSEQTVSVYAKEEATYLPIDDPTALKISHHIKFTTDKAGNYKIDHLLPGSNFSGVTTNKSYHSIQPVKVGSSSQKPQNIILSPSLRRGFTNGVRAVQGRIILPEGNSFRSDNYFMFLTISSDEMGIHEYPTPDADGRFMTEPLPAGTYHLSLSINPRNSGMSLPRDAGRWMQFKIKPDADKSLLILDDIQVEKADLTLKPRTETNPEAEQPVVHIDGPNGQIKVSTTDADKHPVPNVKLEVLDLVDHTQSPLGLRDVGRLVAAVTSDEMGKATLTFPRTVAADRRAYGVLVKGSTADGAKSREVTFMDGQRTQLRVTPETPIDITVTPPIVTWSASGTGGMIAESQSASDGRLKARLPLVAGLSFNAFMLQGTTQNGEILFSKAILADKDIKQEIKTAVTLTRGVEINGKLEGLPESDDGTGWVLARVFVKAEAKMNQVSKGPHPMVSWTVWAPVNRDGSFHIAGIPHGMVSLSGLGKGWITVGGAAALFKIDNSQEKKNVTLGTKPCIEKAIRILLPGGSPAAGATINVSSFGTPNSLTLLSSTRYAVQPADADKYAHFQKEGWPGQKAVADAAGQVTLLNQPHGQTYCIVHWIDPKTHRANWESVKIQIDSKAEGPLEIKLTGKPSL
jgi:hypothetical protein